MATQGLQYNDIVSAQTANAPKYGQQGQVMNPESGIIPEDLASFKSANPGLDFTNQDLQQYNKAVSLDQMSPVVPITLTTPPAPTVKPDALVAGATTSVAGNEDYLKQQATLDATKSQKDTALQDYINSQMGLANRPADLLEAQKQAGADEAIKKRNQYKNLVETGNAAYAQLIAKENADMAKAEATSRSAFDYAGSTGAIQRQALAEKALKAAEITMNSALYNAANGDLTTALQLAKDSVDAKYSVLENISNIKKTQLEDIYDTLNKEEKKTADALLRKQKLEDDRIAEDKEKEKVIQELAIKASGFGAPPEIVSAITNAKTTVEAINAAGKYTSDPLDRILKLGQIDSNKVDIQYKKAQMAKIAQEIKESNAKLTIPTVSGSTSDFAKTLLNSAVNKENLSASEREKIAKALTVVGQLDSLQSNISKQNKTGFFKGKVNNFIADIGLNADVGTINAQLQAIVPNLARGTYGEVGVLTDNDIANYRKTLPNLTSPNAQNDAVLALTLKTVKNSIENTLKTAANSNINVSGFASDYAQVTKQINDIENRIGVSKLKVNDVIRNNKDLAPMIKELYQAGASDSDVLQALGAN